MIAHKTKTQKLIKVGNSYAVTLDSEFVAHTKLQEKGYVTLQYNFEDETMAISVNEPQAVQYIANKLTKHERKAKIVSEVTPAFQRWVDQSLSEDKEAMDKLANL